MDYLLKVNIIKSTLRLSNLKNILMVQMNIDAGQGKGFQCRTDCCPLLLKLLSER